MHVRCAYYIVIERTDLVAIDFHLSSETTYVYDDVNGHPIARQPIVFTFNGLYENRKITALHVSAHVIKFNAKTE